MQDALRKCYCYRREWDLRVWGHRVGDIAVLLVGGCIILGLVLLCSKCSSWVAVTVAVVGDPKPVSTWVLTSQRYPIG